MNIVKFKDIILEDNDVFNEYYKNRYCYSINWKWLVPLDDITEEQFIELSVYNNGNRTNTISLPDITVQRFVEFNQATDWIRENPLPNDNPLVEEDNDWDDPEPEPEPDPEPEPEPSEYLIIQPFEDTLYTNWLYNGGIEEPLCDYLRFEVDENYYDEHINEFGISSSPARLIYGSKLTPGIYLTTHMSPDNFSWNNIKAIRLVPPTNVSLTQNMQVALFTRTYNEDEDIYEYHQVTTEQDFIMNTPVMFVIDDDLREILTSEEVFLGATNKGRIQISEIQYLDESEYNNILMHDNILKHVLLFDDYLEQVNWETTMRANSAASYLLSNQIAGIPELTIDDLKNFRTWLATILLENQDLFRSYNRDFEKTIQMLTYYSENMYDSVCKALINFANIPVIKADLSVASCYSGCNTQVMINPQTTIQSGCSCNGNSVTTVGNITAGCLDMYRRNVYKCTNYSRYI